MRTFHLPWDDPKEGSEQGEVEYELLRRGGQARSRGARGGPLIQKPQASDLGLCSVRVARGGGLEPPTTGPEPVVLPITPPPNGQRAMLAGPSSAVMHGAAAPQAEAGAVGVRARE